MSSLSTPVLPTFSPSPDRPRQLTLNIFRGRLIWRAEVIRPGSIHAPALVWLWTIPDAGSVTRQLLRLGLRSDAKSGLLCLHVKRALLRVGRSPSSPTVDILTIFNNFFLNPSFRLNTSPFSISRLIPRTFFFPPPLPLRCLSLPCPSIPRSPVIGDFVVQR